jgi:hypothetical protein
VTQFLHHRFGLLVDAETLDHADQLAKRRLVGPQPKSAFGVSSRIRASARSGTISIPSAWFLVRLQIRLSAHAPACLAAAGRRK